MSQSIMNALRFAQSGNYKAAEAWAHIAQAEEAEFANALTTIHDERRD